MSIQVNESGTIHTMASNGAIDVKMFYPNNDTGANGYLVDFGRLIPYIEFQDPPLTFPDSGECSFEFAFAPSKVIFLENILNNFPPYRRIAILKQGLHVNIDSSKDHLWWSIRGGTTRTPYIETWLTGSTFRVKGSENPYKDGQGGGVIKGLFIAIA